MTEEQLKIIAQLEHGDKSDIAKKLQLNISTVFRALTGGPVSEKTKRRVLLAATRKVKAKQKHLELLNQAQEEVSHAI